MTTTETTTLIPLIRSNFPAEPQELAQWVAWKFEKKSGDKKPTKVLYNIKTGAKADSTDPMTWATFDDTCTAYLQGAYDGVGLVVTEHDPFVGIDLDGCIVDGQFTDDALRWVELLDSYTEISPSLKGVRIWVKGKKPGERCKNAKKGVEIYEKERFFTVTGRRLDALPAVIHERQIELDALYQELFPSKETAAATVDQAPPSDVVLSIDDQELIRLMCRKPEVQALWDGSLSNHNDDHSGADLALCNALAFYTGRDAARMNNLFKQSKLYRPKWERADYSTRTIDKAIASCDHVYDPNYRSNGHSKMNSTLQPGTKAIWRNGSHDEPVVITGVMGQREGETYYTIEGSKAGIPASQVTTETQAPAAGMVWAVGNDAPPPKHVWSVADLLSADFPEPKWAVPGLLPSGLVVLAGRPKLGKSWLSLQIAVAVGTGGMVLGRKVEQGKVLYLALEDNPRRLQDRLGKQMSPANATVDFRFEWPALVDKHSKSGTDLLLDAITAEGYNLVIIDTISRALGHADQLDQADMNVAFGALQRLAIEKDICLLLVDHHRKSAAGVGDVIDDVMGATSKVGVADAAVGIYRQRGQPEATLKVSGRDVDDHELVIKFDRDLFCWQLVGNADDIKEDSAQSDILLALDEMGGTATITRLAKWLGKQAPNVAREVGELVARGKLVKGAKQGKEVPYSLPHTLSISDDNNNNRDNHDNHDNRDNYQRYDD